VPPAVAPAALLVLLTAAAGAAEPQAPRMLARVQVTATRSMQPAHAVPASVSVIDAADLATDTLGATVSEKLATVPGLLARNRHNLAQDEQLSIRGFGTRASFGIRGVRLLVDGIPATMPDGQGQVSHFNLATTQRIEVLRGPFSALYGNASGGVIQLFTADGDAPPSVGLALAGGSAGTRRASVDARGAGEHFDYTLGATRFATAGDRAHSRATRSSFNGKVNLEVGSTGALTVLLNALHAPDAQDPQGLTRAQFDADPRQASAGALQFDTRKSVSQRQLGVVYARALGADQLRLLGYAGTREVVQFLSIPVATQRNPLSPGGVIDLRSPYAGVDARWTHAGLLAGKPLELVAGVNLDWQRQQRQGYENFAGATLGVRGALRLQQADRVYAFDQYAQATWQPAASWSLMAGLRHSAVDFMSRDRYITATNPDDSGRLRYQATSPVFGASWRLRPALRLYAAHGRGFETPTFNELGYRADGGSGLNAALRPARTRSSEAGLKFDDARRTRSELAVFRADTDDELTVNTSAGGRTTFRNAGRARRTGAEWSLDLRLSTAWRLQLAMTHIEARFREGFLACAATPCTTPDVPVAAGTRIPGVPRNTAQAALRWGEAQGWHATLDGQYVDAVPVNNFGAGSADAEQADAYVVLGASAGYGFRIRGNEGRAYLGVGNLLDRRHAGSVIVNESNRRYFEPAPGRNVVAGIELRWRD
jgi:iron complex outermembrane receptor protein